MLGKHGIGICYGYSVLLHSWYSSKQRYNMLLKLCAIWRSIILVPHTEHRGEILTGMNFTSHDFHFHGNPMGPMGIPYIPIPLHTSSMKHSWFSTNTGMRLLSRKRYKIQNIYYRSLTGNHSWSVNWCYWWPKMINVMWCDDVIFSRRSSSVNNYPACGVENLKASRKASMTVIAY